MSREIIKNRAQSNKLLTPRLKINEKCQSKDFQSWLLSRIEFRPGDKILDEGYVEFDKCAILINGKDFPHGGISL